MVYCQSALLSTAALLSQVIHKHSHRIYLFKEDTFNFINHSG